MAPALAREYHVRPWELELLTDTEILRMMMDLEAQSELADPDSKTNKLRKKRQAQASKSIDDRIKPGR